MPAVQSDAKKVTAHRFSNGAKETGSRFLHYSPRMNSAPSCLPRC
jgi:hypothetical protein